MVLLKTALDPKSFGSAAGGQGSGCRAANAAADGAGGCCRPSDGIAGVAGRAPII